MILNKNVVIILIVLTIIAVMFYFTVKFPVDINHKPQVVIPVDNCNAQLEKCELKLDELNIEVLFDKNIYYLKKFKVLVWLDNKEIESIYIDFKMNNMTMGVNRFKLEKSNQNKNNNKQLWVTKALLPVCITGRADWLAELEVITDTKKYIFSLPLMVKRVNN